MWRQRMIGKNYQVCAKQLVTLAGKRQLYPVGEKSHCGHPAHRNHQRKRQHSQLAGAPVAAKHSEGKLDEIHKDPCTDMNSVRRKIQNFIAAFGTQISAVSRFLFYR